jgi:GTP-binding protein
MNIGTIAIIGRANVGKSTLFNRLTYSRRALVHDQPGVTRDRIYGKVELEEGVFATLIDTAGYEENSEGKGEGFYQSIWKQALAAIEEADVLIFLLDGKEGVHPFDHELMNLIRRTDKRTIFAINKADTSEYHRNAFEFFQLGISEHLPISAAHNRGIDELKERIAGILEDSKPATGFVPPEEVIRVAIIGKPNTGKSSILNRIAGEERSLVSDIAGTTRDSVDMHITFDKRVYQIIDTAGVRRRTKIKDKVESLSVVKTFDNIEEADVVVCVVSTEEMITDQDAKILQAAVQRYKPVLLVVNKWDLIDEKTHQTMKDFEGAIRRKLQDCDFLPVLFTSCKINQRVHKILPEIARLYDASRCRVKTSVVNDLIEKAIAEHTPAFVKKFNKRLKLYFSAQIDTAPPTFVITCNIAEEMQDSYKRYLTRRLRNQLGFDNIPIKVIFKNKNEKKKKAEDKAAVSEGGAGKWSENSGLTV